MLFLITVLGFTTFSIGYNTPQHRLGICGILILTAVNFRWVITARLPSVSYLTFLDQFSLGGLFIQISFVVWDAVIGSGLVSSAFAKFIEPIVICVFAAVFIVFILFMLFDFVKIEVRGLLFTKKCESEWRDLERRKRLFAKAVVLDKKEVSGKIAAGQMPSLTYDGKSGDGPVLVQVKENCDVVASNKVIKQEGPVLSKPPFPPSKIAFFPMNLTRSTEFGMVKEQVIPGESRFKNQINSVSQSSISNIKLDVYNRQIGASMQTYESDNVSGMLEEAKAVTELETSLSEDIDEIKMT
jgi:hypothetical protein